MRLQRLVPRKRIGHQLASLRHVLGRHLTLPPNPRQSACRSYAARCAQNRPSQAARSPRPNRQSRRLRCANHSNAGTPDNSICDGDRHGSRNLAALQHARQHHQRRAASDNAPVTGTATRAATCGFAPSMRFSHSASSPRSSMPFLQSGRKRVRVVDVIGCRQVRAIAIDELLQHRARYVGSADASFKLRSNSSHSGACSSAKNALRCRQRPIRAGRCPASQAARLPRFRSTAGYAALVRSQPPAPRTAPQRGSILLAGNQHQGYGMPATAATRAGQRCRNVHLRAFGSSSKTPLPAPIHKLGRACNAICRRKRRKLLRRATPPSVRHACTAETNSAMPCASSCAATRSIDTRTVELSRPRRSRAARVDRPVRTHVGIKRERRFPQPRKRRQGPIDQVSAAPTLNIARSDIAITRNMRRPPIPRKKTAQRKQRAPEIQCRRTADARAPQPPAPHAKVPAPPAPDAAQPDYSAATTARAAKAHRALPARPSSSTAARTMSASSAGHACPDGKREPHAHTLWSANPAPSLPPAVCTVTSSEPHTVKKPVEQRKAVQHPQAAPAQGAQATQAQAQPTRSQIPPTPALPSARIMRRSQAQHLHLGSPHPQAHLHQHQQRRPRTRATRRLGSAGGRHVSQARKRSFARRRSMRASRCKRGGNSPAIAVQLQKSAAHASNVDTVTPNSASPLVAAAFPYATA